MEADILKYLNKNKNINRGFRELQVWKEAIDLFSLVRDMLKSQKEISFKVKAQIEDSILSVSSNIAEGYCRRSLKENIQFNAIALASLGENYSQIFALTNSRDIESGWFEEYDKKHYSLENKLVKLNKVFISKLKDKDEWKNDYVIKEMVESYE
ncbi:four helix bundle protein [Bacteroidota bacterium]